MSEQGSKSEQVPKKNSSKGSAMQPTPLVGDNVLQSLTKDLTFLHNRFSHLPSDDPIEIALPKAMFHYDEDASAWLNKQDVKEFLRGSMLNISLIQIFMRALREHLSDTDSPSKVGWLCPEQTSETRILHNSPEMIF
ncbi:uncharacterized protein LOC110703888 [Chenopodium quinoa]|uniref:uncharacterized protein LOC110703888 n=1 Tax=Chenopodium quinoa TaxID=63459 RepID=UPI000B7994C5|nr:uncharacterized protein LOC110703888 [Chenopodium quinoa]